MNLLNLPKRNAINKIEEMQNILKEADETGKKAEAQEELLLKQLNELFECNSLEKGKELLQELISEKEKVDNNLESDTDYLYNRMKADGLIK